MNEPLMHATIALAARCAERGLLLTSDDARVMVEELAHTYGLDGGDREMLFDAAESFAAPLEGDVVYSSAVEVPLAVGQVVNSRVEAEPALASEWATGSSPLQQRRVAYELPFSRGATIAVKSEPPIGDTPSQHWRRNKWGAITAIAAITAVAAIAFWVATQVGESSVRVVAKGENRLGAAGFIPVEDTARGPSDAQEGSQTRPPPPGPAKGRAKPVGAVPPRILGRADGSTEHTGDDMEVSHFGFLSIAATTRTQIYIDNKQIGEAPLIRFPVRPGPHEVKVVGLHGEIRVINIVIYPGRDTDEGTINWELL